MLTAGVTTVVSCASKPNVDPSDDDNDIRKDLDLLLKIMNEAHEVFLNYANEKAVLNLNDYQIPELNQLFDLVNPTEKEVELQLDTPFGEKINNFLENNFKTVFDEVNRLITNKYSNYYVNSMPFAFKTSLSNLKVNYVDVAALQKLTTEPIKDLKAVVVNYSFGYNGSFKTLTNPARFNIKYVTTNNQSDVAKTLPDLNLFFLHNFCLYWIRLTWNKNEATGDQSFSTQGSKMFWSLGFGFGDSRNSAIVYTAWTRWQQDLGFVSRD
ncbi:hypothetical protein D6D54_02765 [Spiroplasma poulsonii]|uniref:Uncharacterized protein n=1 Tax=Spiroplasma poulsonii TaxID=2138 RepID=A0A3S0ZWY5_9MOLU|nr:hypothetical protein [Spiroplasma poulsonii]MBW3058394.1 hypothetical protein [Spiroplasma poulsonii]RUP77503.1 hypothetical protein D6D54_02765 [Spiroplasma poulsonii]